MVNGAIWNGRANTCIPRRMAFRDGGDELSLACEGEGRGEAMHDDCNLAVYAIRANGVVDIGAVQSTPHDMYVASGIVAGAGHSSLRQRMACRHHADPSVLEERRGAHLRRRS